MRSLVIGVVVVSALAGCTSSNSHDRVDDDVEAAAPFGFRPDGSPVPAEYELTSCAMPFGVLPIPSEAVQPLLPEDFGLAPFPGDPTGNTATLIAAVKSCDPFQGEPTREFVALVIVDPPEALAGNGTGHFILLSWVTTSPTVAAIGEAWGAGPVLTLGKVRFDSTSIPGAGVSATGSATQEGDEYELHVGSGGEPTFNPARLRAYVVHEREVVAIVEEDHNITQHSTGTATLRAEGPGLADLLGPATSGLGFYVLPDGDVERFRYVPLPQDGSTEAAEQTTQAEPSSSARGG